MPTLRQRADLLIWIGESAIPSQDELYECATNGQTIRIQTVNLHHLYLATSDPEFCKALLEADFTCADGWPVVLLARVIGIRLDRVTGSDFTRELVEKAPAGFRVALIGATKESGEEFGRLLKRRGARLVYHEFGNASDWVASDLSASLKLQNPNLTLVAVTPPTGELVARDLRRHDAVGTVLAIGGSVDMVTGLIPRAPAALRAVGMEWLYRLAREPRRLAQRYLLQCLPALILWFFSAVTAIRRFHPSSNRGEGG